ncbi:glycosyltransferase [Chitinibacteraceae bacterium HSL-7]
MNFEPIEPADRCSVGLVVYRTPVAELIPLFDLLAQGPQVERVLIFDNGVDAELERAVRARGWDYLSEGRNLGFGAGHNRILAALGDVAPPLHWLVNPDLSWSTSPLPMLATTLSRRQDAAAVMPDVRNPDGTRQHLAKRLPSPLMLIGRRFLPKTAWLESRVHHYEMRDADFSATFAAPLISGCCMLWRSEVLRAISGFDECYFLYLEDYDLCRRAAEHGGALLVEPAASVVHGFARASYRLGRPLLWHLSSAMRYFTRWGWFADRLGQPRV